MKSTAARRPAPGHGNPGQRNSRSAAVVVVLTLILSLMMAVLAFAIDIGHVAHSRANLQNAADAAALAAVLHLHEGQESVRSVAETYANFNLIEPIQIQTQDLEWGWWDDETATFTVLVGSDIEHANALRVTCWRSASRSTELSLLFAPLLGQDFAELSATATARIDTRQNGQIVGINRIEINSSNTTDSYHSRDGVYIASNAGDEGHVCSNAAVDLLGPATINGNAMAGPGYTVNNSGGAMVSGTTGSSNNPMVYPPVDPGTASTVNDNNLVPLSSSGNTVLNGSGDFQMSGGDQVVLSPGLYYFNSMVMAGGSSIVVTGPTTIYVAGNVDLRGGTVANSSSSPKHFVFMPMGTLCEFSGNADLCGMIYAPQTTVTRDGTCDFFGSIVAGELIWNGSGDLHADKTLSGFPIQQGLGRARLVE